MMIGMISYLPDDLNRNARWNTTKKTAENLLEIAGWINQPLHIAITNWSDLEIGQLADKNIVYHIISMEDRSPAVSRNRILKLFYASNEDYLMLCDDDVCIYPYYGIKEFFIQLHTTPDIFIKEKLYRIGALMANFLPFKEENMKDLSFCDNWVFRLKGTVSGKCPQIYINFKKHFNKEIYQREEIIRDLGLSCEDLFFDIDLIAHLGAVIYTCTAFIAGVRNTPSVFWKEPPKSDMEWEGQKSLNYLIQLYPKVRQTSRYLLDTSAYYPSSIKKRILVNRITTYEFTEKDKVKKRGYKKQYKGLLKNIKK